MLEVDTTQQTIVRTERGLSIAGTRITLYDVMDYIKADWPPSLIRNWLNLSAAQMADVMDYISEHRAEVEAEYQTVLQHAQENRAYWEARNRDRLDKIAQRPFSPEQERIRAKIQARKTESGMNEYKSWEEIIRTGAPDEAITEKILAALKVLFRDDAKLFELDVHERAISHRFALHLTTQFSQYDVDCEYNKDGHEIKRLHLTRPCTRRSKTDGSPVYPDIIVHLRGTEENLLVIEIKKSTSDISEDCDLKKLRAFREELHYKYALFLRFLCGEEPGLVNALWNP